jgi:hypothetical protein
MTSIKQQKNLIFLYKNQKLNTNKNKPLIGNKRKHSFSEIFDLR